MDRSILLQLKIEEEVAEQKKNFPLLLLFDFSWKSCSIHHEIVVFPQLPE